MTRKDYELIASMFDSTRPTGLNMTSTPTDIHRRAQWTEMMAIMVNKLEHDNPRFDRYDFIKVCDGGADRVPA